MEGEEREGGVQALLVHDKFLKKTKCGVFFPSQF